jgi:lipopolysaccharide/colanic/teichoic acid biosynthesis glycosyltransferase
MQGSYRISAFGDIDMDRCEAGSSVTLQKNGLVRANRNGVDRLISKSACIDGPESSATTADDIATDSEDRVTSVGYQSDEGTLASVSRLQRRYGYRFAKRAFDIVFSAAVLVVFCWLFAIIAILIKVDDPKGPVFFSQERVGKDGRTFRMLKFRSMCVDAEDKLAELRGLNEKTGPVFKIAEDPRITRVGKWLRKLSLDELPQFINVLRSDMSIVGPRPALPAEVATYNDYQRQRLLVKPGMTCYWQTRRNRDSITFDEWVDLDLLYIRQCSVWGDFKLIIQTVGVVLTAQGN